MISTEIKSLALKQLYHPGALASYYFLMSGIFQIGGLEPGLFYTGKKLKHSLHY